MLESSCITYTLRLRARCFLALTKKLLFLEAPYCLAVLAVLSFHGPAAALEYSESPALKELVDAGKLPPLEERLPSVPRVVNLEGEGQAVGRHGGELRVLMGRSKDVRMMVVYGYARLLTYNENFDLEPDLLEKVEVQGERQFTLYLRPGHRWSDGRPFTAEAFRFWWEDIANHDEISPVGPPKKMIVDGEKPKFDVLNETTVRYTWSKPNPFFLPALAGTRPLYIYAPKHYLKKYHKSYTEAQKIEKRVKATKAPSWAALFNRKFRPYKFKSPKLPTLQPWRNTVKGPSQRFVFERNAYYHRVDAKGQQLPYIDRVIMNIAAGKLIPAKVGAGEADLQARHLKFSDYTYLKGSEKRTQNDVRLWSTTKGAHVALFPNLNVEDPVWRTLVRDVRFRRALSLGINRREINQVIYYGLATEGNNSVTASCPLYRSEYVTAWADFDLPRANALLDELGLDKRDDRGLRLLADGRTMTVVVETAGEDTEQTDVLELIHDSWLQLGIKLFTKPMQREVFRNRIFAGETLMAVWGGLENGVPTANISPAALAPTSQQQLQWPKWGQHFETGGKSGESVDMQYPQRLMELNRRWISASDEKSRADIWREMLSIHADQVYSFGLVQEVPQPVVVSRRLRNVPKSGIYNWEPGAHFGIYRPDTFWFDQTDASRLAGTVQGSSG
ncbi:MAG: ABC transporter substrate-binding protein [Gammaproteobacteria bacterium]|nr:ABC transporter substrate-binding protein [Gammaproteobacteria bacterium]